MRVLAVVLDVMDRPWVWGQADCCIAASDVFLRLHGIDTAGDLRGSYRTEIGAARIISRRGGFAAMAAGLAAEAGLLEGRGMVGEIGVHAGAGGLGAMVICVGPGRWAGKTLTGLRTVGGFVTSWRHPCAG